MSSKEELLRLVRRAKSAVDDIESKADDIVDDPEDTADEIRSLAEDAGGYLRKLRRAIEALARDD